MYLTPETPVVTPTAPDLTKPSREGLAYILRHRETWPEGFHWNYANGDHCGMALADKIWGKGTYASEALGNTWQRTAAFFGAGRAKESLRWGWLPRWFTVTPEHVAMVLDK